MVKVLCLLVDGLFLCYLWWYVSRSHQQQVKSFEQRSKDLPECIRKFLLHEVDKGLTRACRFEHAVLDLSDTVDGKTLSVNEWFALLEKSCASARHGDAGAVYDLGAVLVQLPHNEHELEDIRSEIGSWGDYEIIIPTVGSSLHDYKDWYGNRLSIVRRFNDQAAGITIRRPLSWAVCHKNDKQLVRAADGSAMSAICDFS